MYYLLGTELSLYSGKARAYLQYKNVPFKEILSTREVYKNLILPQTTVAFVPVLVARDERSPRFSLAKEPTTDCFVCIQDTPNIIEYIEQRHPTFPPSINNAIGRSSTVVPLAPIRRFLSFLVELWADEWLVLPAMHYRWSYLDQQEKFIYYEFGRSASGLKDQQKCIEIGEQTCRKFKNSLPMLGITPETIPAIEYQFHRLLQLLSVHLSQHHYLLGDEGPTLGDFALMGPFYAHLSRDPYPSAIIKSTAPVVYDYIERVTQRVKSRDRPHTLQLSKQTAERGVPLFLETNAKDCGYSSAGSSTQKREEGDNARVPDTLLPILRHICEEFLPVVESTAEEVVEYVKEQPDTDEFPRVIGFHSFSMKMEEQQEKTAVKLVVNGQRAVFPYILWRYQRLADIRHGMSNNYAKGTKGSGEQRPKEAIDSWIAANLGVDALSAFNRIDAVLQYTDISISGVAGGNKGKTFPFRLAKRSNRIVKDNEESTQEVAKACERDLSQRRKPSKL